jgi:Cu/Ag efflux protein CusF
MKAVGDLESPEEETMRAIHPTHAAALAVLGAALAVMSPAIRPVYAQTTTVQKAPGEISRLVEVQATVVAVNLKDRLVTLKGPQRELTVQVDPRIKNLAKVKPGDKVGVAYYEALAISIAEPGTVEAGIERSQAAGKADLGVGIVGAAGRQVTLTCKILVVNRGDNSVTFKGPEGRTRWVKVKNPKLQPYLKKLKYGDHIQISYTEALAVSLKPMAAKT